MSKINVDLIKEIENRADSKIIQKIAIEILNQISNDSSDEHLKNVIKRRVDIAVREEEK
jgi:hypothetical protein